jgi:Flp pilus assembly pilin Flp
MRRLLRELWLYDQGQDLIEYTLVLAAIGLSSAVLFIGSGSDVKGIWSISNCELTAANVSAS